MKNIISYINILLLGAVCYLAAYYFTARNYESNFTKNIFTGEYNRFAKLSEGVNRLVHLPLSDGRNYPAALTCPDALYSVMSYDLSENPVGLFSPLPVTSWAFTVYDENCNAFFSLDERTYGAERMQAVLYNANGKAPRKEDAVNIKSPGNKGIVVMRLILSDTGQKQMLADMRKEMRTGLIKTN